MRWSIDLRREVLNVAENSCDAGSELISITSTVQVPRDTRPPAPGAISVTMGPSVPLLPNEIVTLASGSCRSEPIVSLRNTIHNITLESGVT